MPALSHDQLILVCLLLSVCVTGVCTVLASLSTVRAAKRARIRAEKEWPPGQAGAQSLAARMQIWKKVALAVFVTVFLIFTLIVQVVSLSKTSPYPTRERHTASTEWKERVQSEEWLRWRKQVHERLSVTPVPERTLKEVLSSDLPKINKRDDLPDILHRDQAIAEVLLSYEDVSAILKNRLGIRKDSFLGTGFSKPAKSDVRIASVSIHEYLIRNHPETHDKVWAWQLKPLPDDTYLKNTIKEIIGGDTTNQGTKVGPNNAKSVQPILDRMKSDNRELYKNTPAVIRFGRFPADDYKGTLGFPGGPGRPRALRVFASNLAEVWDLSLNDASTLSGYIPKGEAKETFFIWIFLPDREDEVIPATWGRVLDNLPKWLEEAGEGS